MSYALTSKGQVTIPKRMREVLDLQPGQRVEFRLNEKGEVVVERADGSRPPGRFAKWRGYFGPGLSTDEIMALTRGE